MRFSPGLLIVPILLVLVGCGGLALRPAEFAWPFESVYNVDSKGIASEEEQPARYFITFNAKPLLFEETGDSVHVADKKFRVIRDGLGYYFITGKDFKNVYVFGSSEGALSLYTKIPVSDKGLESPRFNQRPPFVELLNGKDKVKMLDKDGVKEGGKK
ncbi:MAG TPA: hypothetical protein VI758_09435 [Bacteroidota bacterium]